MTRSIACPPNRSWLTCGTPVDRASRKSIFWIPRCNQRPDFAGFLRLLARGNPDHQFTFSAELRAEGICSETARLLREANFHEVEVGLQSVDPQAQKLMGRHVSLEAFERGARAMLDEGIRVRVDLILGLPGDTVDCWLNAVEDRATIWHGPNEPCDEFTTSCPRTD